MANVKMELCQILRFVYEKMVLDGAWRHWDLVVPLLAQHARLLVWLHARGPEYRLQLLHLGIMKPNSVDDYVDCDVATTLSLLPRAHREYYHEDEPEEEDAVMRIACSLPWLFSKAQKAAGRCASVGEG
jgi:hypothetical protein